MSYVYVFLVGVLVGVIAGVLIEKKNSTKINADLDAANAALAAMKKG
jgi:hypothetical protein